MTNYASTKNIISLEVDISEKITKKNLKDFAFASLKLNKKDFNSDDFIYINHIEHLNQYQILLIAKSYKYIELQVFEQLYEKQTIGLDAYLCDDFFCLYKDGLFYYYQAFEMSLSEDEFLEFIKKKFNTTINNYQRVEKDYLKQLKKDYLLSDKKTSLKNINNRINNSFKIYTIYLFLLVVFSSYFYIDKNIILKKEKFENKEDIQYQEIKKNYTFSSIEKNLNEILENIEFYNLEILSFEYKTEEIKLILSSKIKEDLYLFLKEYKKQLLSSSIYFNNNTNSYEMESYAKLSK